MKNPSNYINNGLENYTKYSGTFTNLNINLGSDKACSAYYSAWIHKYRKLIKSWDDAEAAEWAIRLRQSLKSIFVSAHFLAAAEEAKASGSYITFYYLSYYSLLHSLWGVLYLHPSEKTEAISKPTHSKISNVFHSEFCGTNGIIKYPIKTIMENLRTLREYYSYRMPINSPFRNKEDAGRATSSVRGIFRQCTQLSNLHSLIISEAAERENMFSGNFVKGGQVDFIRTFRLISSQMDPNTGNPFLEPADERALYEFLTLGWELYGHSVTADHMVDEFMTYSGGGEADLHTVQKVIKLVAGSIY